MKRARIVQPGKPFVYDIVEIPTPPDGGLVVKVIRVSWEATDISFVNCNHIWYNGECAISSESFY